jgi:hypothetical protein
MYLCVYISILFLSMVCLFNFVAVPTVWYVLHMNKNGRFEDQDRHYHLHSTCIDPLQLMCLLLSVTSYIVLPVVSGHLMIIFSIRVFDNDNIARWNQSTNVQITNLMLYRVHLTSGGESMPKFNSDRHWFLRYYILSVIWRLFLCPLAQNVTLY